MSANSRFDISKLPFQEFIDSLDEVIFILSPKFKLILQNKKAEDFTSHLNENVTVKNGDCLFTNKIIARYPLVFALIKNASEGNPQIQNLSFYLNNELVRYHFKIECVELEKNEKGYKVVAYQVNDPESFQEQHHLLKQIYQNAFDGMVVLSNDGIVLNANQRFCELSGYRLDEVIGQPIIDIIIPPENKQTQLNRLKDRIEGKSETYEMEYVSKRKKRWIAKVNASPIYNLNNDVMGVMATMEDITSKKKEERERDELREQNDFLLDVVSEAIIHHDKGTILDVNPSFERMTGFSRKEAIGKSLLMFTPPEQHEMLKENFLKTDPINYESYFFNRQGEKRNIQIDVKNVTFRGQMSRVVTVFDITDKKKAEQALVESELLFRNLVENTNDIITLFEPSTRVRKYVNQSFYEKLGYTKQEALDIKGFALVHPDDFDEVIKKYNDVITEPNRSQRFTYRMCHKNGKYIYVETVATNLSHVKGIEGILLSGRDISEKVKFEAQLIESEERFRYFMEVAREAIVIYSGGKIIDCNDTFFELFGYEKEDIKNINFEKLFSQAASLILHTLENKSYVARELKGIKKDGSEIDVQLISRKHIYKNTEVSVIAISDISQRKEVESELDKSRERLEAAINNTGTGIWDWNLSNNYVYFSDSWIKMFGYAPGEKIFDLEEWQKNFHEDDFLQSQSEISNHILGKSNFYYNVHRLRHKDGSWLWIESKGKIIKDENGVGYRMIGTDIDITDRIKSNEELQKSLAYKASVVENRSEFIWMVDTKFRLIDSNKIFNDEFTRNFGYPPVKGEIIFKDSASPMRKLWISRYNECLNGKSLQVIDELDINNAHIFLESSINPIYTSDRQIIGIAVIARNITEQKLFEKKMAEAKEQAEHANEVKSHFMATMSHELRTPINGIIGFTDLALKTDLSGEIRGDLHLVKYSAQNLLRLINDLLDISKVETGHMNLVKIGFDLRKLMTEIIRSESVRAEEKQLDLDLDYDKNIPAHLIGDEVRVGQVISNLINNAIKFSSNSIIKIRIQLKQLVNNSATIAFEIEDEGIGISEDKQKIIFEPFMQAESSYSRQFGGTGLGLTISKRLVDMMGGELKLSSEEGKGSVFFFDLEFLLPEQSVDLVNENYNAPIEQKESLLQGLKILVAEDNEINRILVERILLMQKCLVESAVNGIEAIEKWKENNFDLILLDIEMPGMDGIQVTQLIREEEVKTGKHIPIIAVTAHALKGDKEKFLKAGMDAYVTKPITIAVLFEEIKTLLLKTTA